MQFPAVPFMMEVKCVSEITGAGAFDVQRPKQRPKLPIRFDVKHCNGNSYQVWYFEELDLLVKVSASEENGDFQPSYNSLKPISKEVFNRILESDVFEVV